MTKIQSIIVQLHLDDRGKRIMCDQSYNGRLMWVSDQCLEVFNVAANNGYAVFQKDCYADKYYWFSNRATCTDIINPGGIAQ